MKQRIIDLMKLGFTSQWMEMIIKHGGDFSRWQSFIRNERYDLSIASFNVVGPWAETPQGYDYWRDCSQTVIELL